LRARTCNPILGQSGLSIGETEMLKRRFAERKQTEFDREQAPRRRRRHIACVSHEMLVCW